MKKIISFIFIISGLLLLSGCGQPPLKIGAIYNLTGTQSALDQPSAQGAQLAVKQINEAGGVLGRKLKLILYDGQTDPATIKKLTKKLIEKDKVTAIIGLSDTDLVLAAAPIAAAAQKLFITSGATSPELVRQVPEYLFLACFDDQAQAKAAANYAYQKLRLKSAYVLFDTKMAYTKILAQSFKDDYQDLGGKIIAENIFVTGQQDFSAFMKAFKKLKRKTPDMLYIAAGPEDIGQIIKQFRENNIYEPIFGGDSYDNPLIVQTAGENAHDIYFTTHTFFDEEQLSKLSQQFFKAYFQEYQTFPLNFFAALGYDTVRLLAQAITKAGKTDTPSILKALKNTEDFYGITGKITYSQSSRIPQKDITLVVIKKGHFSVKAIIN